MWRGIGTGLAVAAAMWSCGCGRSEPPAPPVKSVGEKLDSPDAKERAEGAEDAIKKYEKKSP